MSRAAGNSAGRRASAYRLAARNHDAALRTVAEDITPLSEYSLASNSTRPVDGSDIPRTVPRVELDVQSVMAAMRFEPHPRRDDRMSPSMMSGHGPPTLVSGMTTITSSSLSDSRDVLVQMRPVVEGSLPLPQVECEFRYLDCSKRFEIEDPQLWREHCRSHLGAYAPKQVSCPFANCDWQEKHENGDTAWTCRSNHIETEHLTEPVSEEHWKMRLCVELLNHLWRQGIIDEIQLDVLTSRGRQTAAASQMYVCTHGNSRSYRSRRSRGGYSRAV